VIGCAELRPPENAWYKREGNKAVIGCENGDKEWTVSCRGNTWEGEIGNCTNTGGNRNINERQILAIIKNVKLSFLRFNG